MRSCAQAYNSSIQAEEAPGQYPMERDLAGAALSALDFQRLAQKCRSDTKFPQSYEQWRALVETGTEELLDEGQQVQVTSIDVDDFIVWCKRVEVVSCLDSLRAYLILLRRTEHHGEQANEPTIGSGRKPHGRARRGKQGTTSWPPDRPALAPPRRVRPSPLKSPNAT